MDALRSSMPYMSELRSRLPWVLALAGGDREECATSILRAIVQTGQWWG